MQKKVIKTNLATAQELDNLTGSLLDDIKQINAMTSDLKSFLSPLNKAINLISTIESGQELIQKN
jgi:hypothetical protein